jgi:hypothetical protein
MKITKRQLRRIIREEKNKLNETPGMSGGSPDIGAPGVAGDPLAPLGLALEAALREAQKLVGDLGDEIELELEGLLEKLHGL